MDQEVRMARKMMMMIMGMEAALPLSGAAILPIEMPRRVAGAVHVSAAARQIVIAAQPDLMLHNSSAAAVHTWCRC